MHSLTNRRLVWGAAIAAPLLALAMPAFATHAWSTYHWKRTTSQLTVSVGDNVSSHDTGAGRRGDWVQAMVIQSPLVPGSTNPKNCRAVAGTIQVCNNKYGNNGWLGIASISLSGGHIVQGTTKLNDTYFNTPTYNTPTWRALVTCQEVGHDYGLGHQDEDFSTDNTNSCMDYTSIPAGNEHPDAHDYQQLLDIYDHLESACAARLCRSIRRTRRETRRAAPVTAARTFSSGSMSAKDGHDVSGRSAKAPAATAKPR
jgi:hypothetical protein